MITLSMQVHPMDDNIARQKSEMYDAEMTLGMISMKQAIDSIIFSLAFSISILSLLIAGFFDYHPRLSTEMHAPWMYLYLHTCFAFLLQSIYLTACIVLYYC